jgi:pimeloyl-ACP methyl ester carboxylesterase
MTTFVLVHGAWHGGWCWRRVADLLERRGHEVFAPTLTGLGERSHLMSGSINLDTHIADVVNVLTWEDLHDVVLVGHSYGAWPISGAIEQTFDRITSVVYLDAFVPEDGQKPLDLASEFARKGTLEAIHAATDQAFRRPRAVAQEGLHPRPEISAAGIRLVLSGEKGRSVLAHIRGALRPRRHGRYAQGVDRDSPGRGMTLPLLRRRLPL